MQRPNSDLDVLRSLIDLIEAERTRNSFQDKRINNIERKNEQLEDRLSSIESIVAALRHDTACNSEYAFAADPYSLNGDPLCNTYDSDHYFDQG